ncbi:TRAP-type C4-dicarboxylate transport system, small permease component [Cohaesibacter sp. ES.047]|uniref:TRAP transporter small permease n=1 Tax=Cohaesibacter sp. ES.047 TaxID=1798205 RepID=UPI000BBF84F1|nr:TRAP transporter small permease [Cohaesibacter sp. ES.047]SNY93219.1 TRAP-type C4-dicarboxylate transport system, small permease component [Cohaesibacter sp. ES.047]
MQAQLKSIARVTSLISTLALWLAGAGLILMTIFVFSQVFVRYVLNDSIVWSEPAAVILMGWFIFLGAAVGIREGNHLSFDVLVMFIPEKLKLVFYSLSDVVVAAFGLGMTWYGSQLMLAGWHIKIPSLGFSDAVNFMPLVGGGVLMMLFSIERLARRAAGLPTARFAETSIDEE